MDLLLGCGLGYLGLVFIWLFWSDGFTTILPFAVTPLIALFLSTPHFGATLVKVYEKKEDRQRYRFFSTHISFLIFAVFLVSLYNKTIGSIFITVYLMWSIWHYMAQNYGVSLMFLRKRGVEFDDDTKKLIYASFICTFFLAVIGMHSLQTDKNTYHFMSVELNNLYSDIGYAVFGSIYLVVTFTALKKLFAKASLYLLLPVLALLFTQALWFVLPRLFHEMDFLQSSLAFSVDNFTYAFFWIAMFHAIQYLWISTYTDKKKNPGRYSSVFLSKSLLAGACIWMIPGILFSPGGLGHIAYDAGFSVLLTAAVSIHHYVLDGVIWKQKYQKAPATTISNNNNSITAGFTILSSNPGLAKIQKNLGSGLFLSIGIACCLISYVERKTYLELHSPDVINDPYRMETLVNRMETFGVQYYKAQTNLAVSFLNSGNIEKALEYAQKSTELHANERTLGTLSRVYLAAGDLPEALDAVLKALDYEPSSQENLDSLRTIMGDILIMQSVEIKPIEYIGKHATVFKDNPATSEVLIEAYLSAGLFNEAERLKDMLL